MQISNPSSVSWGSFTAIAMNQTSTLGPYQLWDVPDVEGNLDETPVAPDANVLAAVMIRVPQAD